MASMVPQSIILAFTNLQVVDVTKHSISEIQETIESFLDEFRGSADIEIITIWNEEQRDTADNRNAIASRVFNEGGHEMMTQFDFDDIPHHQVLSFSLSLSFVSIHCDLC